MQYNRRPLHIEPTVSAPKPDTMCEITDFKTHQNKNQPLWCNILKKCGFMTSTNNPSELQPEMIEYYEDNLLNELQSSVKTRKTDNVYKDDDVNNKIQNGCEPTSLLSSKRKRKISTIKNDWDNSVLYPTIHENKEVKNVIAHLTAHYTKYKYTPQPIYILNFTNDYQTCMTNLIHEIQECKSFNEIFLCQDVKGFIKIQNGIETEVRKRKKIPIFIITHHEMIDKNFIYHIKLFAYDNKGSGILVFNQMNTDKFCSLQNAIPKNVYFYQNGNKIDNPSLFLDKDSTDGNHFPLKCNNLKEIIHNSEVNTDEKENPQLLKDVIKDMFHELGSKMDEKFEVLEKILKKNWYNNDDDDDDHGCGFHLAKIVADNDLSPHKIQCVDKMVSCNLDKTPFS